MSKAPGLRTPALIKLITCSYLFILQTYIPNLICHEGPPYREGLKSEVTSFRNLTVNYVIIF